MDMEDDSRPACRRHRTGFLSPLPAFKGTLFFGKRPTPIQPPRTSRMATEPAAIFVPFNVAYQTGREAAYVADCYARRHISGDGHYTRLCSGILRDMYAAEVLLTHSCT